MTIEVHIGAGKTTFLKQFKKSLSNTDQGKITIEHEPLKDFKIFYGKHALNPLQQPFEHPKTNAFVLPVVPYATNGNVTERGPLK